MEHIKQDQIINIPNALTVVRILLLPVVVWRFIIGDAAGALIAYLAGVLCTLTGGCNGNLQAISRVVEGMTVEQTRWTALSPANSTRSPRWASCLIRWQISCLW